MGKTIWKFPLKVTDDQVVIMPRGAKMLRVMPQHGLVCLWAEVDTEEPMTGRSINIFGTGQPMPSDPGRFIDSFMLRDGGLVFHAYEAA